MADGTGYSIGRAYIEVVLSLRGVRKDAAKAGAESGKAFRSAFDEEVGGGSVPLPTPSKPESTKRGTESGGAFVDGFRKQLQLAARSLPELKVGVASTEAEQKVKDLAAEIAALRDARIGVDLDEGAALAKLSDIRAQLERLGADSASVQVRTDTAAAAAALAAVEAQVSALDGRDATVDVNVDDHGSIARVSGGLSGLAAAGLAIGPALIPLGALGVAAFAPLAAGALAVAAGAGVAALGISGVSDAMKGLSKAEKARVDGAAAVEAAAGREATAEASLGNALANAADATVRSGEAIKRARQGVTEAAVSGAQQVEAAEQRHTQAVQAVRDAVDQFAGAEKQLRRAQEDRIDTQKALTAATEDARQRLQDLNQQVKDAALSERDAVLDVAEAQKRLNGVLADKKSTALDKQRAQLSYEQSVQNLEDLRIRNSRLDAEKKAADKAGVKGSAQVIAAQKSVADVNDRVATAQKGVTAAQRGVTRARNDEKAAAAAVAQAQLASAQKVADANTRLSDAIRSQTSQQRQSAFSVAQAQSAVTKAQEATRKAATDSAAAQVAALGTATPATLAFARFLKSVQGQFLDLKQAAAGPVLGGLEVGIRGLLPALPVLSDGIGVIGGAVGKLFGDAGRALGSPSGQEFIRFFSTGAAKGIGLVGRILGGVLSGLVGLARTFAPLAGAVGKAVAGWAEDFASIGTSNGVTEFLAYVTKTGPGAASSLGRIVKAIGHIVAALAPLGAFVLNLIGDFADLINAIPTPVLAALLAVLIPFALLLSGLIGVINLIVAATAAWAAVQVVLDSALFPIIALVVGVVVVLALLAIGLYLAWKRSETFRAIVTAAFSAVMTAVRYAWERGIQPALRALGAIFTNVLSPVITFWWRAVVQPYFNAARALIGLWWTVVSNVLTNFVIFFRNVLFPIIRAFYNVWIKPYFDAAGKVITTVWTSVIRPVLSALGSYISEKVAPAFAAGVTAIGRAWDKLKSIVTAPINFVIGTVLNDGIIKAYNFLVTKFGGKTLDPLPLIGAGRSPAGKSNSRVASEFATGGILPGYTPGRDVHDFYSPTAGRLGLSGGEAIMRPEWTRAVGPGFVDTMNALARSGGAAAVRRRMGFAGGGIIGKLKSAADWGKGGIKSLQQASQFGLRAAVEFILSPVRAAFDRIPNGFSQDVLRGMGNSLIGSLFGKADAQQQVGDPTAAGTSSGSGSVDTGRFPAIKAFLRSTDPLPYIWGGTGPGGFDCSGIASAVYGMLTGRGGGYGQRYFTTASDFGALGFKPGVGAFTVGVNPGTHMDGRLDGLGFEAQSTATGILIGAGATPTSRFARQYYLPAAEAKPGVKATVQKLDQGGYLAPGWNAVLNATGRPERVLNPAQEKAMYTAQRTREGNTYNVAPNNYGRPVTARDIVTALRQQEALAGF